MRNLKILLLSVVIVLFCCGIASAADEDYLFDSTTGTITRYVGPGGHVVIPDTIGGVSVARIGSSAFIHCDNLISITIPSSCTVIENGAFYGCHNLTVASMHGVTNIGSGAFSYCNNLTNVSFGPNLDTIEVAAFEETGLSNLDIPDSVTAIGYHAFRNCRSLKTARLSGGLSELSEGLFENCLVLESVDNLDNITHIQSRAFKGCTSLSRLGNCNNLTFIGPYAFAECRSLTAFSFPDGLTYIGSWAFDGCTALRSIVLPSSINTIREGAFQRCTSLTFAILPQNLERIYEYTFAGTSLVEITIPPSVQMIGESAFLNCNYVNIIFEDCITNCAMSDLTLYPGDTATLIPVLTYKGDTLVIEEDDGNTISYGATITARTGHPAWVYAEKYGRSRVDKEPSYSGWYSYNTNVAQVANGVVTAVSPGMTDIEYYSSDMAMGVEAARCRVTVNAVPVIGLNISPNPICINIGEIVQANATLILADDAREDVTSMVDWAIDSTNIATVSESGLVEGLAAGECLLDGIYSHWDGTELTAYTNNARVIITELEPTIPETPGEPVVPDPPSDYTYSDSPSAPPTIDDTAIQPTAKTVSPSNTETIVLIAVLKPDGTRVYIKVADEDELRLILRSAKLWEPEA